MSILILGGGVSGLCLAREAVARGRDPVVLEASGRVGGVIQTADVAGAKVEWGPQGFLAERPGAMDLAEALGLKDRVVPAAEAAKKRYVKKGDRLHPLPMGPGSLLSTPLLSLGGRLRILREPWAAPAPDGPESVHAFATRRVGREAADVFIDAAVTGIFAGDPKKLSLDACFPKMRALEKEHGGLFKGMLAKKKAGKGGDPGGAGLHSMRGGMQELIDALDQELGPLVHKSVKVREIRRDGSGFVLTDDGGKRWEAEQVICTLPAPSAADLLADLVPGVSAALREIYAAPVAVVALVYDRGDVGHPLDGYGYLSPGGVDDVIGCLFESTAFPGRAPEGKVLLRAMVGGARRPEAARRGESEIVSRTIDSLRPILDLQGDPVATDCFRHDRAIPQYDLDHPARIERIEKELTAFPGLTLGGASMRGVSVNRLVADAQDLAERLFS